MSLNQKRGRTKLIIHKVWNKNSIKAAKFRFSGEFLGGGR